MEGTVRLGGNIELIGVDSIDPASMVVLKKIIGSYARKFSEKGIESVSVRFGKEQINIEVSAKENKYSGQADHSNVFFRVDQAFKEVEKQL